MTSIRARLQAEEESVLEGMAMQWSLYKTRLCKRLTGHRLRPDHLEVMGGACLTCRFCGISRSLPETAGTASTNVYRYWIVRP